MRALWFLSKALLAFFILILSVWQGMALWIDSPYQLFAVGVFLVGSIAYCLILKRVAYRLGCFALVFISLLAWWLQIAPSNDRAWQADVAQLPSAEISGDILKVNNVRTFEYRSDTDFTPRWEVRTYDISQLRGVDIYLSDWGATGIVHTIASWDFGNGQNLAVSIETRKEVGETYSALLGFFRQYELYYVVADERDVIGVRARQRGEKISLYHHQMPIDAARKVLMSYITTINRLASKPSWYNAFTANCTTTIRMHTQHAGWKRPLNWRLFANKYVDELMYMRGGIDNSLPLEELRLRSDITARVKEAGNGEDFSTKIRVGLPGGFESRSESQFSLAPE